MKSIKNFNVLAELWVGQNSGFVVIFNFILEWAVVELPKDLKRRLESFGSQSEVAASHAPEEELAIASAAVKPSWIRALSLSLRCLTILIGFLL